MSSKTVVKRAILLAAGRGTRLRPYTDTTPKPLLVHHGKPTLDYIMDSLALAGVTDVVLVTHYLHEQVEHYAKHRIDVSEQSVRCVQQTQLSGTAHALQAVINAYPDIVEQPYILSATDYLLAPEFFNELLRFHNEHSEALTVSMKDLPEAELAGRSSVRFNDDQSIAEIVEKPPTGTAPSSIGANLTFVLPPALTSYISKVPKSPRGEMEVQYAINQWLAAGGSARGLIQDTPSEWQADKA